MTYNNHVCVFKKKKKVKLLECRCFSGILKLSECDYNEMLLLLLWQLTFKTAVKGDKLHSAVLVSLFL